MNRLCPSSSHEGRMGGVHTFTTASHPHSSDGGGYFMSSDLAGIVALAMTVTRGGSKGKFCKETVTGTIAVKTERSTSLFSVGMGSASDVTRM